MQLHEELGTYEEVFSAAPESVRQLADSINEFIISFDPDVHIVPRTGEKSVSYGIGPKKMSEAYCYLMPQKDYVNLGFFCGTSLPDPENILEGTGKKLRHIKVRTLESAQRSALLDLIREARKERVAAAG
ncbi:MAG: DUF1801 domain-containing protein [Fimbriimonadaceae bacterium]